LRDIREYIGARVQELIVLLSAEMYLPNGLTRASLKIKEQLSETRLNTYWTQNAR